MSDTDYEPEGRTHAAPGGDDTYRMGPGVAGTADIAPTGALTMGKQRGQWADVWRELRVSWIFWVGAVIVVVMMLVAIFPAFFAFGRNPNLCDLANSQVPPTSGHPFGFDINGCDYYANVVYGARPSISVGILVAIMTLVLGGILGTVAGYTGGWVDSVIARITDVFLAVPFVLGAIIILIGFRDRNVLTVSFAIAVLSWTTLARIMRSSVLSARNQDYITAARATGAGTRRIMLRHIVPNSIQPAIVYSTITIGASISLEATLTFLGIGLQPPAISWGLQISVGQDYLTTEPYLVFFPSLFLSVTVLGFLLLGDAVRDALDPKLR